MENITYIVRGKLTVNYFRFCLTEEFFIISFTSIFWKAIFRKFHILEYCVPYVLKLNFFPSVLVMKVTKIFYFVLFCFFNLWTGHEARTCTLMQGHETLSRIHWVSSFYIFDVFRDLVPFVQFEKRESTHGGVLLLLKVIYNWLKKMLITFIWKFGNCHLLKNQPIEQKMELISPCYRNLTKISRCFSSLYFKNPLYYNFWFVINMQLEIVE